MEPCNLKWGPPHPSYTGSATRNGSPSELTTPTIRFLPRLVPLSPQHTSLWVRLYMGSPTVVGSHTNWVPPELRSLHTGSTA